MKKLLNTLYVTSENSYLALDGENIVIYEEQEERGRLPLHNLEGIVSFFRNRSLSLMKQSRCLISLVMRLKRQLK